MGISRRQFVSAGSIAAAFGLAGCSGLLGEDDAPLEVLHGWTGGDGADAAEALVDAFEQEFSDMEANFEAISGGGNEGLDATVTNRLGNDNPPSSFANWPGKNLDKYSGALGSVDDVWADNDFEDVHIDEAVDLHQTDGTYHAVPLGSHRLNNLFYNINVVDDAGVDPSDIDDVGGLVEALDAVATETDAIPFTHLLSSPWATVQLFGTMMLGQEGVDAYMSFIDGSPDQEAVRNVFDSMQTVMENYISDDASTVDLTASNQNIIDSEAAFIHQGNWAAGAFRNAENFEYESEWGAVAFPGTEGMYELHFDSFLYPSDNPTSDKTKQFLGFVGGTDAQVAFNQFKGSIPTRTDVDMGEFGPYLQDVQEDFANADERPPNLYHGLGVSGDVRTQLEEVISSEFTGPFNPEAAASGFVDAVSN